MVSIIIPCYNVSNFVGHTIDSILLQTDNNWEIIAVNDGSSDSTLQVLNDYAIKSDKITVVDQINKGVSAARNTGLKYAKGEWVYYCDADDIVNESLIETINIQLSGTDMVCFEFDIINNKDVRKCKLHRQSTLYKDFLTNRQPIAVFSLAVKKNFLFAHNIKFEENTYYGEDREWIAKIFQNNPKINCIKKSLYKYIVREESATLSASRNRVYNAKLFSSLLASERTYKSFIGRQEEKRALAVLGYASFRHLKMVSEYKCDDLSYKDKVYYFVNKYLKGIRFYGMGHIELCTALVGILAYNKFLFRYALRLYKL